MTNERKQVIGNTILEIDSCTVYTNNEEILEILVSDLNEKQTMIDTFVTNLEEEKKLLKN